MSDLRSFVYGLVRVPAEPAPPPGDPATLRTFRASPRYFRYSQIVWALKQLAALSGIVWSWFFLRTFEFGPAGLVRWGEYAAWALFIAQLPFSYVMLQLDFQLRWYMLTDRSLRIRDGILVVREKTMAFANVQNITVRQNPLQRLFGIGTVAVRAAGGGSGGSQKQQKKGAQHSHEALFEGVDNIEEIRDLIRQRIRQHRDSGLGDPDDVRQAIAIAATPALATSGAGATGIGAGATMHAQPAPVGAGERAALLAARRVLEEVRALRSAQQVRAGGTGMEVTEP